MYDSPSVWYSSNEGNTNISKDSKGMIDDCVMIAIDEMMTILLCMSKMMSKMDISAIIYYYLL